MSVERALRLERPLSPPGLAGLIAIGVALAGMLLGVGLLLS
ncbi:hypothetical protein [Parafrigoribacterium mesophilum]